ncbi:MAG: hypothetical protein JSU85_06155 [Candidatus Zixiibacteriota bacterium]|nr:MAG: hypothetical protein JSU85_06155 [candidate division Zixibacteria bacterium]
MEWSKKVDYREDNKAISISGSFNTTFYNEDVDIHIKFNLPSTEQQFPDEKNILIDSNYDYGKRIDANEEYDALI